jgi:glycosyltransferase involved in cell wall biosynthesis
VIVRDWPGYVEQKNHAAEAATHDWILSIDADERVSEALAEEIRSLVANEPPAAGYRIPRVSYYLGRWIRTTTWYPDYQLRLYDRRRARWYGRHVHEGVKLDGDAAVLTGELEHYSYRDVSDHLARMSRYAALAARGLHEEGRRASFARLVVAPAFAFLTNYILRQGFRDGRAGFIVSALNSFYVFLKYAKLWELQHTASDSRIDRPSTSRKSA